VKLVVVASSQLWPTSDLISSLASLIASLPRRSEVYVRGRIPDGLGPDTVVAPLEKAAIVLAEHMGFNAYSIPPGWGPSRDTVFARDYSLVKDADLVVGFFLEGDPMGGGAGHVVHAAIQKGIACEAWMWTADGLIDIGSDDGYHPAFYPDYQPAWDHAR
jgi:hypothetical protein